MLKTGLPKPSILYATTLVNENNYYPTFEHNFLFCSSTNIYTILNWYLPALSTILDGGFICIYNLGPQNIILNVNGTDTILTVPTNFYEVNQYNFCVVIATDTGWNITSFMPSTYNGTGQNFNFGPNNFSNLTTSTAGGNVAVGTSNFTNISSGNSNTALGNFLFQSLTTGNHNLALGIAEENVLTTGSNNIYLGAYAVTPTETGIVRIGDFNQNTLYISPSTLISNEKPGTASTTLTYTNILDGLVATVSTAASLTIDTAANIDNNIPGLNPSLNSTLVLKCLVSNTSGTSSLSFVANTGITLADTSMVIPIHSSRLLYFVRTGSGAYTVY